MGKKIAILGAGPAGLALALKILQKYNNSVNVDIFEQRNYVGGLAASFEFEGLHFDFGSHRLHPSTAPIILSDLQHLLGHDLLLRPRNGRIRLLDKFVKFPLNPFDLALNLPPTFTAGIVYDGVAKRFRKGPESPKTFADYLMRGLGPTVCHNFYFPYARKLWGLDPEKISLEQAKKRVSADNFSKIAKKLLSKLPGVGRRQSAHFYYPRKGFGQISTVLADEVQRLNGRIYLSAAVERIHYDDKDNVHVGWRSVEAWRKAEEIERVGTDSYDYVFSTIPINNLIARIDPAPPPSVLKALNEIHYRAMVLLFFILKTDQFSLYDAHYFPGPHEIFSRMSEPKNYYNGQSPEGLTGICLEIPCAKDDAIWSAPKEQLQSKVLVQLEQAQIPLNAQILSCFCRHIENVYPIYNIGYEADYRAASNFLTTKPNIISLGRQGLFMHNNTHHSMEMAYRAAECLESKAVWNQRRWEKCLSEFASFTVED